MKNVLDEKEIIMLIHKAREVAQIFGQKIRGNEPNELVCFYTDSKISILSNYFDYKTTIYTNEKYRQTKLKCDEKRRIELLEAGDWIQHVESLYQKSMALVENRQKLLGKEL